MANLWTTEESRSQTAASIQAASIQEVRQSAGQFQRHPTVNVGTTERILSALAGGGFVAAGLSRRSAGGLLMALIGGSLVYRGLRGQCQCYQMLGISTSEHPEATSVPAQTGVKVERTITVQRPADELFAFWRKFENLPRVFRHVASIEEKNPAISHWVATGPLGKRVEWDAEIHNIQSNELIAWRSLPGSDIDTAGSVHFEPSPQGSGTSVRVSMKYNPPAGKLGATIASLLGAGLEQQLVEDLRQFKRYMEAGKSEASAPA